MTPHAFDQIRQAAVTNPAIAIRLFQSFANMCSRLLDEDHRKPVRLQVEALWEMIAAVPAAGIDRHDIEAAYRLAGATTGSRPRAQPWSR